MPRIYNSESEPLDFCRDCWQYLDDEETAAEEHGGRETGPDGRGDCFAFDAEHPPYSECDYTCEDCNKLLTDKDD